MKFAVNYSPAAEKLLDAGRIEVDLFKCPEFPDLLAEVSSRRTCYVHFPFRAGRRGMDQIDWPEAERMMRVAQSHDVNAHLAPCAADFDGMAVTDDDPASRRKVIEAMVADAGELARRFGPEHVLLESVMWDPYPPWQIPVVALEAKVVRRIVEETGCGFILDLAHASISARYFGLSNEEYISTLPLGRLREVHVTGTMLTDRRIWEDHYPMAEYDWRLIEWAMGRIREGDWPTPRIVTFEYGGVGPAYEHRTDPDILAEQTPRLLDVIRSAC